MEARRGEEREDDGEGGGEQGNWLVLHTRQESSCGIERERERDFKDY